MTQGGATRSEFDGSEFFMAVALPELPKKSNYSDNKMFAPPGSGNVVFAPPRKPDPAALQPLREKEKVLDCGRVM